MKKYRFNRKEGLVYLEEGKHLRVVGSELKMIILKATDPFYAQLFPHMPPQDWVKLTFADEEGFASSALLNSGTAGVALEPWLSYKNDIESKGQTLNSIITTVGFTSVGNEDFSYFDYSFKGVTGKPGLAERMEKLIDKIETNIPGMQQLSQSEYERLRAINMVGSNRDWEEAIEELPETTARAIYESLNYQDYLNSIIIA